MNCRVPSLTVICLRQLDFNDTLDNVYDPITCERLTHLKIEDISFNVDSDRRDLLDEISSFRTCKVMDTMLHLAEEWTDMEDYIGETCTTREQIAHVLSSCKPRHFKTTRQLIPQAKRWSNLQIMRWAIDFLGIRPSNQTLIDLINIVSQSAMDYVTRHYS
jgi:hypothetical protein